MNCSVVIITHRPQILNDVEKIMIMRDGQVQAFGPSKDVLDALQRAREQAAEKAAEQAAAQAALQAAAHAPKIEGGAA
jgi:ABC-type protease/lipase transport system fused ATPase/permease subunit